MARYLINKSSALGDIAQSLAVARYLKQRDKACKIDWIVEQSGASLVERHPDVDRVIPISWRIWRKSLWRCSTRQELLAAIVALRAHRYDAVFDLQGNIKSGLINSLVRAEVKVGFDRSSLREKINAWTTHSQFACKALPMPTRYMELVKAHFKDLSPAVILPVYLTLTPQEQSQVRALISHSNRSDAQTLHFLICPFSAWPSKHLGSDQLEMLIDYLVQRFGATIWLASGSASEAIEAKRIATKKGKCCLLPRLSLPQLQHFMRMCAAVFAMDSLPLHLAQSAHVAVFGFFGPSHYRVYSPDQGPGYGLDQQIGGHLQGACPFHHQFLLRCPHMRTCAGPCLKNQAKEEFLPAIAAFADRLDRRFSKG